MLCPGHSIKKVSEDYLKLLLKTKKRQVLELQQFLQSLHPTISIRHRLQPSRAISD